MADLIDRQAAIDVILDDKIGEKSLAIMRALGSENEAKALNMACDRHVEFIKELPSAQPETYKEKLDEIASALSEKFAYMNTCLNERDIILGYLGVKRSCEIHCNTDCTNTKCESHPFFSAQSEQRWIPVSERLPEENSDILVTYVEKDEKRIVPVNYGCGTLFDCFFDKVLNPVGVLAWMPLPEPYREDGAGAERRTDDLQ